VRRRALLPLIVLVIAGCGVDPQSAPEDIAISPIPAVTSEPTTGSAGPEVTLWFLADERLTPLTRPASESTPATALELLAEGPDPGEADAGLTTAVARQPFAVDDPDADGVLTVEVTRTFSSVSGDDQLREVAQVVWTATEFDGVDAVRFATDGEALEVPTDLGLSDEPVDRDDYASLAPGDGARATPSG
jgi:spore germination protein GerM